jgi:hypothetical protein
MTKHRNILGLGLALTILVLAGGTTAAAKTATLGAPTVSTIKPAGYKLVSSGFITIGNGTQVFGRATCPRTSSGAIRRPQSGGVFISSGSVFANINSSWPDSNGVSWDGWVNNDSGFSTSFEVWAVCAKPRTGYTQVATTGLSNPNGTQTGFTQVCPTGTKILGGGALLQSNGYANINSSYPFQNGWHVDANNASGADETFGVYAVCSKYPSTTGYAVHQGSSVDNPPGAQTAAGLACPTGQSSLGGGAFSNSGSTAVNLNSTEPTNGGWLNYMNNASGGDAAIIPLVICAT